MSMFLFSVCEPHLVEVNYPFSPTYRPLKRHTIKYSANVVFRDVDLLFEGYRFEYRPLG